MKPIRLRTISIWAAAGVLITFAGVLLADEPLYSDADGNVWFRTPNDTVLKVAANGDVSIDGQVIVNCRERPPGEVKTRQGKVQCVGDVVEVEDRFGNELEVYSNHAEATDDDGNEYELMLGGSSVVVPGDWRGAGTHYRAADTDRILTELGAVEEGDVIRLALAGDVLFDFDSTAIRDDAAAQLAKAAHVIRQRSVGEVYVVGHTDSVGGDDYNLKLSRQRAEAVMSWLNGHEGIPDAIMVGRGMGSGKPVAHNTMPDGSDNPAGRAKNRRVEILLAEREGVDLNAIAAGAVRAGEQAVRAGGQAVRAGEQAVRASEQAAAAVGEVVSVDEGGVGVGGVEVSPGGVTVGGVTVGTGGKSQMVGNKTPTSCKSGDKCSFSCLVGSCEMICEADAGCDFACPGGHCEMRCRPGAVCAFGCAGGHCRFVCAEGSECRISCLGGDCTRSED